MLVLVLLVPKKAAAYSVLTHQALIDASWDGYLKPLLKRKYPHATEAQLKEAHAYAYGGAIAPDMGYYPYGSKFFTHLTHYVRSGDFVMALLKEAKTVNEYAFALGNLCHYHADMYGHPIGTNRSVPVIYPKMGAKYGKEVTYAEDHMSHMRTEFGFDVLQTARGNYASKQYHDFIGFQVDTAVMERAFYQTYGLHLNQVFKNFPKALKAFRWSVAHFFPAITRTAWATKKADIKKLNPSATARSFTYRMQRRTGNKSVGKEEEPPTLGTTLVSFLIRIAPKVGPLRPLKFRTPGPEAEKIFIQSFDTTLQRYTAALQQLEANKLTLINGDYDTGEKTAMGEYILADESYSCLLLKLHAEGLENTPLSLRQHFLRFYVKPQEVKGNKREAKRQAKINLALKDLQRMQEANVSYQ
jgi:hypothetical protein